MSATPVRHNTALEVPGAPRKNSTENTVDPDVTITNFRLNFESEEIDVSTLTSPLDKAMCIDEEAEEKFIEWLKTAPKGIFSYEGLADIMEESMMQASSLQSDCVRQ